MKYSVMSDIHSNYTALKACVNYSIENNVDGFIFLGDYISDSCRPEDTLDLLYQLKEKYNCYFVKGNREEYMEKHLAGKEAWCPSSQNGSLFYTFNRLRVSDFDFIRSLNIHASIILPGEYVVDICHGSVSNSGEAIKADNVSRHFDSFCSQVLLCGHTHRPLIAYSGNKRIVNPGSVGVPVSGSPKAEMAFMTDIDNALTFDLVTVKYDVNAEIERIKSSGLESIGKFWTFAVEKELQTGKNYVMPLIIAAKAAAKTKKADSLNTIPEEYWEIAAKALEIV